MRITKLDLNVSCVFGLRFVGGCLNVQLIHLCTWFQWSGGGRGIRVQYFALDA